MVKSAKLRGLQNLLSPERAAVALREFKVCSLLINILMCSTVHDYQKTRSRKKLYGRLVCAYALNRKSPLLAYLP